MANKEEHEDHPPPPPPRGNEWEVVSLTSSAYAAAPSPYNDPRKYNTYYEAETSFMSDHFVFPPSEHENLPIDDEPLLEEEDQQRKEYEDSMLEGQGLSDKLSNNEESIYGSSRHIESGMYEHGLLDADSNEYAGEDLNLRRCEKDATQKNLPCEAWWRRRGVSMYSNTREAKALWSLFIAAAVTGLVVIGQRWQQQERWQVLQLKWQSSISSEKLSRVFEPLSRLKDVIVRGNSQASLIRSASSSEI